MKRIRQKGVMCSVAGCDEWSRSRGVCNKHGMALRRYGSVHGAKAGQRRGVCICGNEYIKVRSNQEYCSDRCYRNSDKGRASIYSATKRYRSVNRVKSRARDVVVKRIKRGVSMSRQPCIVCGDEGAHAHHHNYKRADDVTFLCARHHTELHSWDSM